MADIELVIKIPEELKDKIDNANEDNYRTYIYWFETTLYCAIKNGTQLPKYHGKLIDADKTIANAYEVYSASEIPRIITDEQMYAIRNVLTTAPTVIEATEVESEE